MVRWEYRLVHSQARWGECYEIIELWFRDGHIAEWTPVHYLASSPAYVRAELEAMMQAVERPVIEIHDLPPMRAAATG